jgi:hypothetical protein
MGRPWAAAGDLGAVYHGALRTETAAGAKWAYANHGFAVLGQLVEDIGGERFADHIESPRGKLIALVGAAGTVRVAEARPSARRDDWC